jgi:hypothetical protein
MTIRQDVMLDIKLNISMVEQSMVAVNIINQDMLTVLFVQSVDKDNPAQYSGAE